jgi:hypothetical protein
MRVTHSLPEGAVRLADHPHPSILLVTREDLLRPVSRRVVGHDHEIDACRQVKRQVLFDDVALVPREQGHHDRHEREP